MNFDQFKGRLRLAIQDESINSFAIKCGMSEGLLRKYLTGTTLPGMDKLVSISETAGVSIEWLATGNGPMRKGGEVIITKEEKDFLGRTTPRSYTLGDFFVERLHKQLGGKSIEWLVETSGVSLSRMKELLSDKAVPTYDEIDQLAKALGVEGIWLAQESHFKSEKIEPVSLDEELLQIILQAVEEVSSEIGREETILPVSERSRIAVNLYRLFSRKDTRQYVTLDNMKDQVVNMFFLTSAYEKIDCYKKKLNLKPSDKELQSIEMLVEMRKLMEEPEQEK